MSGARMLQSIWSRSCSHQPARLTRLNRTLVAVNTTRHYASFSKKSPRLQNKVDLTKPARTRFAPSPTGYLHIGSLRTALYNYLLARATGGDFVIRIEDTDRDSDVVDGKARLVTDAEERLFQDLKWAGLDWDESVDVGGPYGPYRQSDRLPIYEKHSKQLLEEGKAYRCFCKPEDLDKLKKEQMASGHDAMYPGTCSHISASESDRRAANGEEHCIRFKYGEGKPLVNDIIYGNYQGEGPVEDMIIIKRDGFPTYHFANVVDDHLMQITHVIRGAEWLPSTPRHVKLYDAFGWLPPQFAHVALLVNSEGQKLSKRHGDVDIASWRDKEYLPPALLNYVALLGWSNCTSRGNSKKGNKRTEVMTLEKMVDDFAMWFTKGNVTVNDKHEFFQSQHMADLCNKDTTGGKFLEYYLPFLEKAMIAQETAREASITSASGLNLGPLLPKAAWDTSSNDISSGLPYIKDAMVLDRKNYTNSQAYVAKNCYLLWQIPRSEYETTIRMEYDSLAAMMVYATSPEGVESVTNTTPSQIAKSLRRVLADIPEESWNRTAIHEVLGPFATGLRTVDKGSLKITGWHFIRWVVNAAKPGPALADAIAVLGKEEMMMRVDMALDVLEKYKPKDSQ